MSGLTDAAELPQPGTPLPEAALTYARLGVPIFPCRGKVPMVEHWDEVATTNELAVRDWWTRWPTANIGAPMGTGVDAVALDVDHGHHPDGTPKAGWDSFAELEQEHGELPTTLTQRTPSGGEHQLYAYPDPTSDRWRNSQSAVALDIDVRGQGGFIVLCPSIVDGATYGPWTGSKAPMPGWLVKATRKPEPPEPTWAADLPDLTSLPDGEADRLQAYAQRAVEGELKRLREAQRLGWAYEEPDRRTGELKHVGWNQVVFFASCNILEFANAPWCRLTTARAWELVSANAPRDSGFDTVDHDKAFRSAVRTTQGKARAMPPRTDGLGPAPGGVTQPEKRATSGRPCTDLGNGERMADLYGDRFRYVAGEGAWYYWNGRVWEQDALQRVAEATKAMVKRIWDEADAADPGEPPSPFPGEGKSAAAQQALVAWLDDPDNAAWYADHQQAERLKAWAVKSQDVSRIGAAMKLFASEREVAARTEDFNGNKALINTPNGVYDLDSLTFGPARPEYMLSRLLGCEYHPDATAPRWEQYLTEVLPDPDVRSYIQRAIGYTLSGRVNEKALFFLLGPRDTGKTIFIETMLAVFGEYGLTAAQSLLAKKRDGAVSNDAADLKGYRLAITSETGHSTQLDEALIKSLSGGDTVRNRALYANNSSWKPECAVWLASNHHPRISGDEDAIWGRIKVLNFTVQFSREPGAERPVDPYLPDALAKERAGILNWVLEGYASWRAQGLAEPMRVQVDSAMYQREQDTVSQFLEEKIDEWAYLEHPSARFDQSVMWLHYEAWCRSNAVVGYGKRRFNETLRQRYESSRSGKRYWVGIGMRAEYTHLAATDSDE